MMNSKFVTSLVLCVLMGLVGCSSNVSIDGDNSLSSVEKKQGFELLFDGVSMDQWRNYRAETIKPKWQVIDGAMVLTEKGGGDIVTKEKYDFFDLRFQWAIAENGNSGVMFRVNEQTTKRLPWMDSPEFQLKDPYRKPATSAGALYGLVEAPKDIAKEFGQWNTSRILLEPGPDGTAFLKCWLNDTITVDLTVDHSPGSEWMKLIDKANQAATQEKFLRDEEFFKVKTGHMLLQDHGNKVSFKSIRIRRLEKE
jgi:hypothetical protein